MGAEVGKNWYPGNLAPDSPADTYFAVTPHDTNALKYVVRALYVGVAGDVAVEDVHGNSVTFVGVGAGSILPVRANKVLSTGTDADSIVGLV